MNGFSIVVQNAFVVFIIWSKNCRCGGNIDNCDVGRCEQRDIWAYFDDEMGFLYKNVESSTIKDVYCTKKLKNSP